MRHFGRARPVALVMTRAQFNEWETGSSQGCAAKQRARVPSWPHVPGHSLRASPLRSGNPPSYRTSTPTTITGALTTSIRSFRPRPPASWSARSKPFCAACSQRRSSRPCPVERFWLQQVQHTVRAEHEPAANGTLFPLGARALRERLTARRDTVAVRLALATSITPIDRPCRIGRTPERASFSRSGTVIGP